MSFLFLHRIPHPDIQNKFSILGVLKYSQEPIVRPLGPELCFHQARTRSRLVRATNGSTLGASCGASKTTPGAADRFITCFVGLERKKVNLYEFHPLGVHGWGLGRPNFSPIPKIKSASYGSDGMVS